MNQVAEAVSSCGYVVYCYVSGIDVYVPVNEVSDKNQPEDEGVRDAAFGVVFFVGQCIPDVFYVLEKAVVDALFYAFLFVWLDVFFLEPCPYSGALDVPE